MVLAVLVAVLLQELVKWLGCGLASLQVQATTPCGGKPGHPTPSACLQPLPPLFDLQLLWLVAHVGGQLLVVQGLAQELVQVLVQASEQAVCFKKNPLKHHFYRCFFAPPSIVLVVFL